MSGSRTKNLSWNESTIHALGFYRLIGRTLGIWPLNCHENGSKCRLLVSIIVLLTFISHLINEFASGCVSVFNTIDYISLLGSNCVCVLKIIMIRIHWKEMYCIVESAVNDWSSVCDGKSCQIMRKYAYLGRIFSIFPFCIGIASIGPLVLGAPPTITKTMERWTSKASNSSVMTLRNLPIGTGCTVVGISTSLYLFVYFFQLIQMLCSCTCDFGCDTFFFGFSMHLCAQLELLKINIAELGQHSLDERNIRKEIVALIQRHNHLLRLLNLVEDIYHIIMLGKLVASGSYISLSGVQMLFALQDEDYMAMMYSPIVISLLLLQLFIYSIVGDYLSSHADDVRKAVYNCSWYNFSSRLTKDLTFVLMRSSDAFQLTAGKVFLINIESFTSIVKTIMSFFSVMKLTIVK